MNKYIYTTIICSVFYRLVTYRMSLSSDQEWRVGIPLTGITQPHLCVCSKTGPTFPKYTVFTELVIARFVDIGGVVDHHCLKLYLIIVIETKEREI